MYATRCDACGVAPLCVHGLHIPGLQGANFENSILTGSTFGKNEDGVWANLKVGGWELGRRE